MDNMRARGVAAVPVTPNPKPLLKTNPNNPMSSTACSRASASALFIACVPQTFDGARRWCEAAGSSGRAS